MSGIREQLGDLSIERRTLLMRRLRERQEGRPAAAAIPVRPGPRERFPLSSGQLRLWLQQQLAPGSTADHLLDVVELAPPAGAPDTAPLERALAGLTARHEVLRTAFPALADGPVQAVLPASGVPSAVPLIDLRGLPGEAREQEAERAVRALAGRSFSMEDGRLFRQAALLTEESLAWTFCFHHLIYDGWSSGVLQRELPELVEAHAAGRAARLPPLPVQYGDFAAWQREQLQGERLEQLLSFWRERLAGLPESIDLPADRPRTEERGRAGERRAWHCPGDLALAAAQLARRSEVSLFVLLLAVFQLLLGRLAGSRDVAVATAVAGRERPETQGLIGFFVNTLVLRTDLGDGPGDGSDDELTLAGLLRRVRDTCQGAFAHQDLPFERLVEELRPHREAGSNPLTNVLFSHEAADAPTALAGPERVDEARFELLVTLVEAPGVLQGVVEYRTGLFDAATVERWLRCYETLLAAAARDPLTPVADLAWLTPAESRQALHTGNGTATGFPRDRTLPELFAEQAALRPDAAALREGGAAVTYGELQRRAAALAARLAEAGVTPGSRVGLLLPPGIPMIVAMLAALQAGAAYVPLETGAPAERLEGILADAAPAALVRGTAGPALATRLPVLAADVDFPASPSPASVPPPDLTPPAPLSHLPPSPRERGELEKLFFVRSGGGAPLPVGGVGDGRGVGGEVGRGDLSAIGTLPDPGAPACVLFTSGSTGRPKGVVISHRSILRLICANRFLDLASGECFANGSNPAFDASTLEIWMPLLAGGTVVALPKDVMLSAARMPSWLAGEQIAAMFLTTSLFHHLADQDPGVFAGPWAVLFGGEAADPARIDRILAAGPPARLINIYGPTEVTTVSTTFEPRAPGAVVPIGRPIGNTLAYVVDGRGAPVPEGVAGELWLGGDGVSQGYLGRPDLTAERFVPDPFTGPAGGRLYRTGDRVRRRADGELVFLGRRDHQVKLRGFRIELSEIEAALAAQPEVGDAIVVAAGAGGDRRLVAYVAPAPGARLDTARLTATLGRRLPPYMIPAAWVTLDAFPVNANGKLDRGALPDPATAARAGVATAAPAPPRDATEELLAGLWSAVLGVPGPGIHDDFFLLGGHSLLAIDLIGRVRREGLSLDLLDLFEEPTVAGLARRCRRDGSVPSAAPGPVTGPCELTPRQRMFLRDPFVPPYNTLLQPLPDGIEPAAVRRALAAMLRHHEGLRSRFHESEEGWAAHIEREPAEPPLCWLDLGGLPESGVDAVLGDLPDFSELLDLAAGPLLAQIALSTGPGAPGAVLWMVHHLVDDGWSLRLLAEDFQTAYEQIRHGVPVELPPKTTSMPEWSRRLREWEAAGGPRAEIAFWTAPERRAAGSLPADHPEGPGTYRHGRRLVQCFPRALTRELLGPAARRLAAQPEELVLAALQAALGERTAGRPLLVELERHGRDPVFPEVDLSRTVGWLSVAVPLLLRPGGDPPAALRRLQEELRGLPSGGHGWSLLAEAGDPAIVLLRDKLSVAVNLFLAGEPGQSAEEDTGEGAGEDLLEELPGPIAAAHLDRRLPHPLSINVLLSEGRLEIEWGYSAGRYEPATIRRLAAAVGRELERLVRPSWATTETRLPHTRHR